jgi:threonine/homoserine/homoserine lactone efflux protein
VSRTDPLANLLFGLLLGFSLVVPPGPMNAWIAATSTRSFRGGFVTGLGAMTADGVLGTVVYVVDRAVDVDVAVRWIYLAGAVVMAYLASRLFRPRASAETPPAESAAFVRAVALGLSNPFQVVWWLTAGVAFAYLGGAVLLVGLFGAIAVWIVVFPWGVHAGSRRRPAVARAVALASGAILVAFAVYFAVLFGVG